jgi:hypothetical protein
MRSLVSDVQLDEGQRDCHTLEGGSMPEARRAHAFGTPNSYEPLIEATAARIVALLRLQACWFEAFPFDFQLPCIEPGRIVLPAFEPGVASWSLGGIELPVRGAGLTLGRFVLVPDTPTCGVQLSPRDRAIAIELAAEVGDAIATAIANDTTADSDN